LYGDFTMMVDAMAGRILAAIDKAGMADNTLVIFTSDNGPVWYDTDVARFRHDSAGGFRGMKADAWEAGHRMPFVVRWPGKVKAGSVSSQLISHTDLLATCAAIVGVDLPQNAGEDSFDMLPVLLGRQPPDRPVRDTFVLSARRGLTVRQGPWKLIPHLGSGGFSKPSFVQPGPGEPAGQLYNLDNDPGETNNLYDEHPEIVERLTALGQQLRQDGRSRPR
jgi:arylsulfatase A-like enzyme